MKKLSKPIAMILIVLFLTFTSFTGCSTTKTNVDYSFSKDDSPSAVIEFESSNPGVNFIDYEGAELPKPKKKTKWSNKIEFPAEEPLKLNVRAHYESSATPMMNIGVLIMSTYIFFPIGLAFMALSLVIDIPLILILSTDKKIIFECPPLEADKTYVLKFRRKKKKDTRALLLLDAEGAVVCEQGF